MRNNKETTCQETKHQQQEFYSKPFSQKENCTFNDLKQIENEIFVTFREVRSKRYMEDITEEEYRAILIDIHNKAISRGETVVAAMLAEAYNTAENITLKNEMLMRDLMNEEVTSLNDFIEKFPDKAFAIGVVELSGYRCDDLAKTTAEWISKRYHRNFFAFGEELVEYVELLNGDTKRVKQLFIKAKEIMKKAYGTL